MDPVAEASLNPHQVRLIGYRTCAEVAGRVCAFALVVLAARFLSTSDFGLFSLAWTSGWLIAIAGDFGLQIHLTRQVAQSPDSSSTVFLQLLKLRLGVVVTLLAASAVGMSWVPTDQRWPLLAIVSSHLIINLVDFCNHFFRGLERSDWEASINLFQRVLALLLGLLLLSRTPHLNALAAALQLSAWSALAVAAWLAWSQLRTAPPPSTPAPPASMRLHIQHFWPIGLGILLSALYFRLDLFVLESFWGSRQVGLYNAVFRLVDASRLFPAAVLAVVFPLLCRPAQDRVFRQTLAALSVAGVALAAGGWWLSDHVVDLFYGPRFLESAPAFRLLLLSLPLFYVNFLLTHQLIAKGLQKAYAGVCAVGLFSSAVLALWLIPEFSLGGAAWACLIREGLISAACCWMLLRAEGNI